MIPIAPNTAQMAYSTGKISNIGVRIAPMELGNARRQLVGIPYKALVSFGFWGNSFAARWLSNPWGTPPIG